MSEAYERWLVPTVFRPFALELAGRVAGLAPKRVLEVAAGTGVLTRELLAAGVGGVTATDLNQAMVDVGAEQAPGAEWRQADALALPFGDGAFDVVAGQFGVMFFPDKAAGYAELGRVAGSAGTVLLSTWGPVAEHEFEMAVTAALEMVYPEDPPRFLLNIPHGYCDPHVIAADVEAGGLQCRGIHKVVVEGSALSVAGLTRGYCTGTPVRAEIEARGDLDAATDAMIGEMERLLGPGPVTGRMSAYVIEAAAG
jgi:SAM-dependent methyltransferase